MNNFFYRLFQNTGLIIISLGLLYGGITLVQTQIPFWNLVYGLPAVFLGILTTLITFNELTKNQTARVNEYHLVPCIICKKETLTPHLIDRVVCPDCQYKMAVKLQMGALVFFLLLAIPVTYHVTQQIQDIRQNAKEQLVECSEGEWNPQVCRCGSWQTSIHCAEPKTGTARKCQDAKIYCCENNGYRSACYLKQE